MVADAARGATAAETEPAAPPLARIIVPVTPFEQNCSIV
jgi:hypothetical protein